MTRQIGSGDIEHYYSGLVLKVAETLTTRDLNTLTHRSRQRLLNKGVQVVKAILNDPHSQSTLRIWLGDRTDYEASLAAIRVMTTTGIPTERKWP